MARLCFARIRVLCVGSVQTDLASHVYVVTGPYETKKIEEMIPEILPQLGRESFEQLKNFASQLPSMTGDSVPSLIDDTLNFEEIAKSDEKTEATESSEKTEAADEVEAVAADVDAAPTEAAADSTDAEPAVEAAAVETDGLFNIG